MQKLDSLKSAVIQAADSSLKNQIFSRLDMLGSKLGVAAEHISNVLNTFGVFLFDKLMPKLPLTSPFLWYGL